MVAKLNVDAKTKLQFIEVLLQWEGALTATKLINYFDLSRTTAQKWIAAYRDAAPDNLSNYNKAAKCYQPTVSFKPKFTAGKLEEYLSYFGDSHTNQNLQILSPPLRNIDASLVRFILKACREQQRIDIEYLSLSSGDKEGRIISPHSLINDGLRWHVRAYCEKNRDYRDFVLSRFMGQAVLEGRAATTAEDDLEWNTWLTIRLRPDPRLDQVRQECVALDYCMNNHRLDIQCRAALVKYLLQKLRVDTYHHSPEGQQIVVESQCWEEIRPYLML